MRLYQALAAIPAAAVHGSRNDTPDGSCWCDDQCEDYGDCCGDYVDQCTGGGGPSCTDLVCDFDPYCCAVEWDDVCDDTADWIC